ncbi:MAG: DEAD/DEAH box helicase family protein [Lachnospiraceae bacterium]|nr:DEAD/DEAH box helicase family protein [Lachnospiraceae bacterium]
MAEIKIKTAKRVVPMIYAYTTPEIARHNGWTKIGYTEQAVEKRLKQQAHTIDVIYHEEWKGNAVYDDGSGEIFSDKDFHVYLRKLGIENNRENEWFHIDGTESQKRFFEFRSNRGIVKSEDTAIPYTLRNEQAMAVLQTEEYFKAGKGKEYLWNAKPRFGKTLSVYELCKKLEAENILIVTNRPAIANSWYSDYAKFLGTQSGYQFVSNTDSLKGKPLVVSREDYVKVNSVSDHPYCCIEFVSLQDLKGSIFFGGDHKKLQEVADMDWDLLVIDEAHEGVDTYKTDVAFEHIKRKFTLHLSGTPFKALANDKFPDNAIFNWTYADEQSAKRDWNSPEGDENPYATLPQLNMFTYQMSEVIRDELEQGIEIQGETEEYAFDLNLFFETKNGQFVHESSVDKFLDAMTTLPKFPFSTEELRNELKHTFWLLNRVDSAKALAKKLEQHPVFGEYKVILAAGDGVMDGAGLDSEEESKKSFDKVVAAVKNYEKTITLSVGQLTTGVTIPEWTAVLMLSNMKSPSLYMQAAFRAQNPCLFAKDGEFYRKKNAYVFDFDLARTLMIFEEFANDLSAKTSDGRGDAVIRKENVRELLNFFPVIGEDENGEMVELDAEKVLSIPRKIRSQEVVRRGFMSDFLFQNISHVFHAPQEVIDIITSFTPVREPSKKADITPDTHTELSLDDNGEVFLEEGYVIGKSAELFGEKIYGTIPDKLNDVISDMNMVRDSTEYSAEKLKQTLHTEAVKTIIDTAKEEYASDMRSSTRNQMERRLKDETDSLVNKAFGNYKIEANTIEKERQDALDNCVTTNKSEEEVNQEFDRRQEEAASRLQETLNSSISDFVKSASEEVVRTVETSKKEREKKGIEDSVKDHLRGFSRTIPSFLMAYGTEETTLENFDKIIPDEVFEEVTSISLAQFRFLRDGGAYTNEQTGEEEMFEGKVFDAVVFNDSVREFLNLKRKLADYFDEDSAEDIFDYIPPQKTNQIFTPKWVVKKMVDMLEQENPGCFDMSDKTFVDLYMKSGLYMTEIIKRLYQSNVLKEQFPNKEERLQHIFEKQVYGLAPTEIIYRIATNYILGFDDNVAITKHNFRQVDALEYAKNGILEEMLDEIYKE